VIGSTLILIFSGFEDFMYYFLNGGFPPNDVNWNWMWQAKLFGSGTPQTKLNGPLFFF
jgi:hypothetical protein